MKIIKRGEADYEQARVGRVFNHRRPNRYPVAVVFPETAQDVATAVKLAHTEGYRIAVRAGGHSWAAWSVRDEALLIDLQHLNKYDIDLDTRIAAVQPAVKGGMELNPFLYEHGLMFCGGHCPTVGVGGFLLQGGQGWNARGWKWAAEYIVAIDVVTAEGQLVRADATENSDLYWAARGAGPGFFGIVTCFYLQTIPLPKAIFASTYVYPIEYASEVLSWWQAIHGTVSLNIELVLLGQMMRLPPSEGENHALNGHNTEGVDRPVIIVHALVFEETEAAALAALLPFENCPVIEKAYVRRTNYATSLAEQVILQTDANPEGHRWAVNNAWLQGSAEDITALMLPAFTDLPTAKTFSLWYSMAPLRVLPDMAFSLQTEIYFATYAIWENENDDEKNKTWVKNLMQSIEPITAGQYLGDSDFTVHQRKFMADAHWERLKTIQKQRDPNNIFVGYLASDIETLNANDFVYR